MADLTRLTYRVGRFYRAHIQWVDVFEVWDAIRPYESASLEELASRTGYSKFRTRGALYHLKHKGFAARTTDGRWRKTHGKEPLDRVQHH